jgi:hypothetical protein
MEVLDALIFDLVYEIRDHLVLWSDVVVEPQLCHPAPARVQREIVGGYLVQRRRQVFPEVSFSNRERTGSTTSTDYKCIIVKEAVRRHDLYYLPELSLRPAER